MPTYKPGEAIFEGLLNPADPDWYTPNQAHRFYDDGSKLNDVQQPRWYFGAHSIIFWYKLQEITASLSMHDGGPLIKVAGNDTQDPETRMLIHVSFRIWPGHECKKRHECAMTSPDCENYDYIGIFTDGDVFFYDTEQMNSLGIDLPIIYWDAICMLLNEINNFEEILEQKLKDIQRSNDIKNKLVKLVLELSNSAGKL